MTALLLAVLAVCEAPGAAEPEPVELLPTLAPVPPGPRAAREGPCRPQDFPIHIDVGHSPDKPGATSARGRPEHSFNHDFAQILARVLRAAGFEVAVPPSARFATLSARAQAAADAAVLVSIHHDSVQERYLHAWTHDGRTGRYADDFSGHSLFVAAGTPVGPESVALGQDLGRALVAAGLTPTLHHAEDIPGERRELLDTSLGLYRRDTLGLLRMSTVPAVLVEVGVIVHRAEELRLLEADEAERFAEALASGLRAACDRAQSE